MSIEEIKQNEKLILRINGRLDSDTSPLLEKKLEDLSGGIYNLEMDFSNLDYISSAGLRVLLDMYKIIKEHDGVMAVLNPKENVEEVLVITGFSEILM